MQDFIAEGVASGARLVSGGLGRANGLTRGYYARPTLFADVPPHAAISREEPAIHRLRVDLNSPQVAGQRARKVWT